SFGDMGVAQQTIHNQISVTSKRKVEKMEFRTTIQVNEWHVYSVEWTPTKLTFLVDNKITGVFYKSKDKLLLNQGQWTFDRPFYLILNQSVGDGKSDNLRVSTNHSYETQFDWVRVYKII
ncbi:MAG: family 16 glycosylhydrolase, partial [Prevotella sp.]|nr:family 16 glycosylhydrolase [Prevotella sp.]